MLLNIKPLLKYRDYRLLYIGQFISWIGNMLTYVAFPYQVYHLTHSSLAVGNIGIVQLVPLLITSLWGGALADRLDRRKLLLVAEVAQTTSALLLFLNALLPHPSVAMLYLLAGLASALNGFHRPTIEAMTQKLVEPIDMPAVSALATFKFSVCMIAGPAVAGILLAKYSVAFIYLIDALTYLVSFLAIYCMKIRLVPEGQGEAIVHSIREGFNYALRRQELMGSYVVDFIAMVFGMPMALFPALAAEKFHSVHVLGWLYAGPSIGMLLSSIVSGWADKVHRHGAAIAFSALVWGLGIVAFGFSNSIYFAVFFLAIAGAADNMSGLFRMTLWNQTIPSHFRGRLAGIEMISYMSGPLLGNAEAGLVAAVTNTKISIISGGVLCIIGVIVAVLLLPKFWRYSAKTCAKDNKAVY